MFYKLGQIVTDSATGLEGMLTHLHIEMNGSRFYFFQPKGLNPETGAPVKRTHLVTERIQNGIESPEPNLPINVLGTEAEDIASGFKGTAVAMCLHVSGCVHVTIQPKGKLEKTGAPVEVHDFDIRRLKGSAIPVWTDQQIEADKQARPSPGELVSFKPTGI